MTHVSPQGSFAFSVTWDYRCPFARNAHEHIAAALAAGAPWDVEPVPFSLNQVHRHDDDPPIWDDPGQWDDLRALEAALVVREQAPGAFWPAHVALFRARHDHGRDLRDAGVLGEVLGGQGLDAASILAQVGKGWARAQVRKAHEAAESGHGVFGVPTFIVGEQAVFARVMTRPGDNPAESRSTIERILELAASHPELNELKHTAIPR